MLLQYLPLMMQELHNLLAVSLELNKIYVIHLHIFLRDDLGETRTFVLPAVYANQSAVETVLIY